MSQPKSAETILLEATLTAAVRASLPLPAASRLAFIGEYVIAQAEGTPAPEATEERGESEQTAQRHQTTEQHQL